jgi:hypothetical protein
MSGTVPAFRPFRLFRLFRLFRQVCNFGPRGWPSCPTCPSCPKCPACPNRPAFALRALAGGPACPNHRSRRRVSMSTDIAAPTTTERSRCDRAESVPAVSGVMHIARCFTVSSVSCAGHAWSSDGFAVPAVPPVPLVPTVPLVPASAVGAGLKPAPTRVRIVRDGAACVPIVPGMMSVAPCFTVSPLMRFSRWLARGRPWSALYDFAHPLMYYTSSSLQLQEARDEGRRCSISTPTFWRRSKGPGLTPTTLSMSWSYDNKVT